MAKRTRQWPPLGEALPVPVIDNHTHLPVHEGEIPKVDGVKLSLSEQLERAEQAGVRGLISSGCELPALTPTVEIARAHPQVRAALAIHPNEAALHAGNLEPSPDGYQHEQQEHHVPLIVALERVAALLGEPEVVAVGETGLDYFRTAEPGREAQKESFRAHLEMARARDLPVQIHDREAHRDTLELLGDPAWRQVTAVFHCFSGDAQMARVLAERGWYASFAGPITYPANGELREAFRAMPRELVLVETDAPYLAPAPYRGCPNASYVMAHTVRYLANLWEVSPAEAAKQLNENTRRVYGDW